MAPVAAPLYSIYILNTMGVRYYICNKQRNTMNNTTLQHIAPTLMVLSLLTLIFGAAQMVEIGTGFGTMIAGSLGMVTGMLTLQD